MRILFICNEYPPSPHGGQGTFVKQIAASLSLTNSVFVLGFYPQYDEISITQDNNVMVIKYKRPDSKGKLKLLRDLKYIGNVIDKFVDKYKIDVIEFPDSGALNLFCRNKAQTFIRLHNGEKYILKLIEKKRSQLLRICENISYIKKNTIIIAVSKYILQAFNTYYIIPKHYRKLQFVIYNGVNLEIFKQQLKILREPFTISYLGTIKPIKGVSVLLSSFSKILKNDSKYILHIYGNDTILNGQSYFELLIKKHNLQSFIGRNIIYHGSIPISEVQEVYNKSFACIFPSLSESFGLVAVESMACGAITIYTNQGAGSEIIEDGISGFLIDPQNEERITEVIHKVFQLSPKEEESIRMNAHKRVHKYFGIDQCATKTLQLYKRTKC